MSELSEHAARIAAIVAELEEETDEKLKARVFELLENVDHLHRTALWKLFERLSELGGKGLVERLVADPAIHTLFVLYDLIPAVPLTPVAASGRVTAPSSGGFVPLSAIGGVAPRFEVDFRRSDLPSGTLQAVEVDGTPVLLVSADDEIYAYRNACSPSILPLHLGTLAGDEIHCPWHGCRFDRKTGKLVSGPNGLDLERFLVAVEGDIIRVGTTSSGSKEPEPMHAGGQDGQDESGE